MPRRQDDGLDQRRGSNTPGSTPHLGACWGTSERTFTLARMPRCKRRLDMDLSATRVGNQLQVSDSGDQTRPDVSPRSTGSMKVRMSSAARSTVRKSAQYGTSFASLE